MTNWPMTIYYRKSSPDKTYQEFYEEHMKKIPSKKKYEEILEELNETQKVSDGSYDLNETYNAFYKRYMDSVKPKYFLYVQHSKVVETVDVNNVHEFQAFLEHAKDMNYEVLITDKAKSAILSPPSTNIESYGTTAVEVQPIYSSDIQNILK